MPTYQYKCKSCGYQFEIKQGFGASPVSRCPQCEGKVQRIFSPPYFHFRSKTHPSDPSLHQEPGGYWMKEGK